MNTGRPAYSGLLSAPLLLLSLTAALWAQGPCPPAQALDFDGVDDFAVVPASASLDFALGDAFTVELWMKSSAPPTAPAQESLIEKWNGSCASPYPFTLRLDSNGYLRAAGFDATNCSSVAGLLTSSPLNLSDARWHHVAYLRDPLGISTLFVDGVLMGTSFVPPLATTVNGLPLHIGRRGPPSAFPNFSTATMDEIRISRSLRYTANFDPQTRFTADPDTVLLLHLDGSGPLATDDSGMGNDAILGSTLGPDPDDPQRSPSTLPPPSGLVTRVNGGSADASFKLVRGGDSFEFFLDPSCLPGFVGGTAWLILNAGPDALPAGVTPGLPGFNALSTLSTPTGLALLAGNGASLQALGLGIDLGLGPYAIGAQTLGLTLPSYTGPPLPLRIQAIYAAPDMGLVPLGVSNEVSAELRP